MKNWKGVWIVVVSILHTIFALLSVGGVYKKMLSDGLIGSVNNLESGLAAWFFLFGILMFVLGLMIYFYEKQALQIPKSIAFTLLGLTVLGAAIMPASGFWLLFPPVLAMLYSSKTV